MNKTWRNISLPLIASIAVAQANAAVIEIEHDGAQVTVQADEAGGVNVTSVDGKTIHLSATDVAYFKWLELLQIPQFNKRLPCMSHKRG